MNKADKQPLRDKGCLARNHLIEKGAVGVRGTRRLRVMPRDDVIGEAADRVHIATRCEKLEGADPNVARCDASENSPGQRRFAPNRLASGHCGKRSSCRNPERRHSLADNVFTQHRPKRRTSVAAPGIRRGAGPLELDVAAYTGAVDDLAKKNGASITELRDESPELVAGISHGERLATLGHQVTREHLHTLRCGEPFWIEAEVQGELRVQPDQTRCGDRSRPEPREKTIRQPRVAVIKFTEFDCLGLHVHHGSSASLSSTRSTI